MENKIYLPGTDYYYRIGNKVFNKKDHELIPIGGGRYRLKKYKNHYIEYRPPGEINKPERMDTNNLNTIPGFSNYSYSGFDVYSRTGLKLKPSQNNSYYLKNDEGIFKRIRLNKILK